MKIILLFWFYGTPDVVKVLTLFFVFLCQKTVATASMITAKTLPLVLKAAAASMPTTLLGQRPTIAMVTAINSQKAVIGADAQSTAVNLQTTNKVANQGTETFQILAKNAVTLVSD